MLPVDAHDVKQCQHSVDQSVHNHIDFEEMRCEYDCVHNNEGVNEDGAFFDADMRTTHFTR